MQTATSDFRTDIVVKCPATGEVVGRVAATSAAELEAVAARPREAQPRWQRLGVEGRARWLGKWRDWLLDHADELSTVVQLEEGKSWGDTFGEMLLGTQIVNYWIVDTPHHPQCRVRREGKTLERSAGGERSVPLDELGYVDGHI
jgi:acyl-CoA reductase-like NAD-dependent aldehyde dehydrogenase